MQHQLQKVYTTLRELKAREDQQLTSGTSGEEGGASISQPLDWRKSIKKNSVQCLICGATFKQLSARHLRQHDLDPRIYRQQFGIPRTQALSAKETTALRRRVVQNIRPWEKAPTYKKSQEEAAPAPAPEPAPTRPKRARKKAAATSASA
jgi:predicted transcriptional regulator